MIKKYWNLMLFFILKITTYTMEIDNLDYNSRLDANGYSEMWLINTSTKKEIYRVNVLKGDKNDGSKYIEVQPKVITVMPLSKGKVKLFGIAPKTAKKGQYDFNIQVTPIVLPLITGGTDGKVTGVATVNTVPVIEMFGYVGAIDFQKELQLKNVKFTKEKNNKETKVYFETLIENNSYATVNFGVAFYKRDKYITSKNLTTMGPHKKKKIKVHIPLLKGNDGIDRIELYRIIPEGKQVYKVARKDKGWN